MVIAVCGSDELYDRARNWRRTAGSSYNIGMDETTADERPFRFSLRAMLLAVTLAAVLAGFIRLGMEINKSTKGPNAPKSPPVKGRMVPPSNPLLPIDKLSPI